MYFIAVIIQFYPLDAHFEINARIIYCNFFIK